MGCLADEVDRGGQGGQIGVAHPLQGDVDAEPVGALSQGTELLDEAIPRREQVRGDAARLRGTDFDDVDAQHRRGVEQFVPGAIGATSFLARRPPAPQHLQLDAWDPDAVESVAQNGQAGARE